MSLPRDSFKTLLPSTAPLIQKNLDYLGADVLARIDLTNLTLLPKDIPTELLSHLALMYDVNIDGLEEYEQRNLIEKSFDIHRHLGTGYALKEAMSVIGFKDVEILEWYNQEDFKPYTFGIKIEKLNRRGALFLIDYIYRYKNERSRLALLGNGKCAKRLQLSRDRLDTTLLSSTEGVVVKSTRVCFKNRASQETTFLPSEKVLEDLMKDNLVDLFSFIEFGVVEAEIKTTVASATDEIKLKGKSNAITKIEDIKTTVASATDGIKLKGKSNAITEIEDIKTTVASTTGDIKLKGEADE